MVGQPSDRVLLVDDEPFIRRIISGYLVAAGYVVRMAVDGLDALEKLRAGLPDLIISDLDMPRMSGIEFLAVVHKRFPQIPVIVISADATHEMPNGVSADAYYHKNEFGFETLLHTITDLTGRPLSQIARPHVDHQPVQARWDGDGPYVVECPDCMRSTSVPRSSRFTRGEHIATCIHCRGVIALLIGEGDAREGEGTSPPAGCPAPAG